MSRIKKIVAETALVVILALFFALVIKIVPEINTRYPSSWSEAQFNCIKVDDDLDLVLKKVGLPFSMTINFPSANRFPETIVSPKLEDVYASARIGGADIVLQYSECRNRFGDCFRDLDILIYNRRVKKKKAETYHEWW